MLRITVCFVCVCQGIGVHESFLASAMLKRLESLRRLGPPLNKPLEEPKKATKKRTVIKLDINGSDVEEEEEEESAAAANCKQSRHKTPAQEAKKKKSEAAAAGSAAAAAGGARPKMKWDTPASANPEDPTYEPFLDPKNKEFYEKNPEVPARVAAEDKRLLVTGPYLEPEPMKVAEWHAAIDALFGFPVSRGIHLYAHACFCIQLYAFAFKWISLHAFVCVCMLSSLGQCQAHR
jgi:hypothetical protein